MRGIQKILIIIFCLFLNACSNVNPDDPGEPFNRSIYKFNIVLNDNVLTPTAKIYETVVPSFFRDRISDEIYNISSPYYAICYFFSFDIPNFVKSITSFVINTIFGFLGTFNVAKKIGIAPEKTNFDNTLRSWGAKSGKYIMLPILGPSSPRNIAGKVIEFIINPFYLFINPPSTRNAIRISVDVIDLLDYKIIIYDLEKQLRKDSNDFYVTLRSIYMQQANNGLNKKEGFYIEEDDL